MTAQGTMVIVGASLAGGTAAGVLRDEGYDGRLSLIGAEEEPPYERPPLSKELLRGELGFEDALVRPASWYEEHDVDARFGTMAVQIDVHAREVVVAGVHDHLEIWDRRRWGDHLAAVEGSADHVAERLAEGRG